jgi:5-methylcytosine-specific restriction endonuclease McrA
MKTLQRNEEIRPLTAREIASQEERERKKKEKRQQKDAATNDFWANYKHPLWQKKRLEIMQRDEFVCTSCGSGDNTLNVHHLTPYKKGAKPWEYENDELVTICEECHKYISETIDECKSLLMGRCWCTDSATEVKKIMEQIDGMDPSQLRSVWIIIKECKKV